MKKDMCLSVKFYVLYFIYHIVTFFVYKLVMRSYDFVGSWLIFNLVRTYVTKGKSEFRN